MNKPITIFHVDDEDVYINDVKSKIELIPDLQYLGHEKSIEQALLKIRELQPDILLLDIELSDGTGIELAEQIKNQDVFIVFLTNYSEYTMAAFNVFALHYLIKPLPLNGLTEIVQRYRYLRPAQPKQNEQYQELNAFIQKKMDFPTRIFVNTQKEIVVLQLEDIVYLSAEGSYTSFHLKNNKSLVSGKNLKTYSAVIENNPDFVRIHRSYIINLRYLEKIDKKKINLTFVFTTGESLTMNSFRKDEWFNQLKMV